MTERQFEEEQRGINAYTENLNALIGEVQGLQFEHLQFKFNEFLYMIHRRKEYMERLRGELESLSEAIEKDKAITEISQHIEEIIASRNHLMRKQSRLHSDIEASRALIRSKRAQLAALEQQCKRINHDTYELKAEYSKHEQPQPPQKVTLPESPAEQTREDVKTANRTLFEKTKRAFHNRFYQSYRLTPKLRELIELALAEIRKEESKAAGLGLGRLDQTRARKKSEPPIASSQLMEREYKLIINGSIEKFEHRRQERQKAEVMSYEAFSKLSGKEVFLLMTARPEILESFEMIFSSSYSRMHKLYQSYKRLRNQRTPAVTPHLL